MRLMSSEMPCSDSRKKPIGSRIFTGQRSRPPALGEPSSRRKLSTKKGQVIQASISMPGSRKRTKPKTSTQSRVRGE